MMKDSIVMRALCPLIGLWISAAVVSAGQSPPFQEQHRLINTLFDPAKYLKDVIPLNRNNHTLMVQIGYAAVSLADLDERNQVLHMYGWFRMVWHDTRLKWDPSEYGGIHIIRVNPERLWKPDVELFTSVKDDVLLASDGTGGPSGLIYSDGTVFWIPPKQLWSHCPMDMSRFPFDSHTCQLDFASWAYDGFALDLDFYEGRKNIDLSDYRFHQEWDVLETSAARMEKYYPCCVEPYPYIRYNITFKRKSTYYSNVFIGPAVIMALLIPLTFILPPESGEKMTLGGTIMICLILLLIVLEEFLPTALSSPCLLAMYYTSSFVLMGVSLALSALTANMSRLKSQPPAVVSKIMIGCFGRLLCVNPTDQSSPKMHDPAEVGQADDIKIVEPGKVVNEWRVIAVVMDRLLAVVFLVVVIILTIKMFA